MTKLPHWRPRKLRRLELLGDSAYHPEAVATEICPEICPQLGRYEATEPARI
jgi:hypothetical protein